MAASSASARRGLEAAVRPPHEAVGSAPLGPLLREAARRHDPDLLLLEVGPDDPDPAALLAGLGPLPAVVLADEPQVEWLRGGAGALLRREAGEAEIAAALQAAAAGLLAVHPEVLDLPRPRPTGPGEALTAREAEVLEMMAEGLSNKEIAARLGISDNTVKFHLASVYGKLGVSSRAEAVTAALRTGRLML